MERVFRSRGFRLFKSNEDDNYKYIPKMKIYYEPQLEIDLSSQINHFIDLGKIHYFEYSADENGIIDTVNFHNNLSLADVDLYEDLTINQKEILDTIPIIFDETFLNYTIGYRIKNEKVVGVTFYYYPTIWKENRYGIKGVTNPEKISLYINKFINTLVAVDNSDKNEIIDFSSLMYKYKGISVTFSNNRLLDYKLYGKFYNEDIYSFLENKVVISTNLKKYGDIALAAIRIKKNKITGYNLYYLS